MKQHKSSKFFALASAAFCIVPFAFGQSTVSISDGDWANPAIWNNGVPSSSVEAFLDSNVTSSGNEGQVPGLGLLDGGSLSTLTMNSGSQIETTGGMSVNEGTLTINSGASLVQSASPTFGFIGRAAGTTAEMIVNGGTFSSVRPFFMGVNGFANATGTLTVNSGSFSTTGQMIFGGSGTNMNVAVNGGTLSLDFVVFDQSSANAGTGASRSISVDGGDFILTTGNQNGSLAFSSDPSSVLNYDSGSIIWQGVANLTEFSSFQTTFDGWVNDSSIQSSQFTDLELKSGLQFQAGTGAVLSIPEPASAVLGMALVACAVAGYRRRR